jgi:hypothetical protein
VTTLCTIAVFVCALVGVGLDSLAKKIADTLYLLSNLWQVGYLKWCSILLDEIFQRDVMKEQITILKIKTVLREIVGLIDQVEIGASCFQRFVLF